MLNKKSIEDIDVTNKRVLVRCDFNVPFDKQTGEISSDKRIVESLKTIKYLIEHKAKIVLCSHLGKTGQNKSLEKVAKRLSELLEQDVLFIKDIESEEALEQANNLQFGEVALLENTRMSELEEKNDLEFAKKLARFGEIFVNDAFGSAHRAHASTEGVTHYLPAVSGYLIKKEIEALDGAINNPKRPLVAIVGGSKVSSKIDVLNSLIDKVDTLLIGGGMAYTFVKARGGKIGSSLCEDDKLQVAMDIMLKAAENEVKFYLPVDNVVATEISDEVDTKICAVSEIEAGYMGLDIGPKTIDLYTEEIKVAGTVIWNGPVGVFEYNNFSEGTKEIAKTLANSSVISVIGGGDSAAAVEKFGYEDNMSHVSTGGGASLEFIEGKKLPGIEALQDK